MVEFLIGVALVGVVGGMAFVVWGVGLILCVMGYTMYTEEIGETPLETLKNFWNEIQEWRKKS